MSNIPWRPLLNDQDPYQNPATLVTSQQGSNKEKKEN